MYKGTKKNQYRQMVSLQINIYINNKVTIYKNHHLCVLSLGKS